jgi:hypothetical protein
MSLGPLRFDRAITSRVTAELAFVDRFTRRRVKRGVRAGVVDPADGSPLPYRLIPNLSGGLALSDLPSDTDYTILVDPRHAGYVGPFEFTINPSAGGLQVVVDLDPKPNFAFEPGTTLVRGSVVVTAGPVEGAVISVDGQRFATLSDKNGSFALPLSLSGLAVGEQPEPQVVDLLFEAPDLSSRRLTVTLVERRTHVFSEPIELDGDNTPPFAEQTI